MMPARGFIWYFAVPDMIVMALIYLLVAYGVLSLVLRDGNIVMRVLGAVTSPARVPVAILTPRLVPRIGVAVFAILCLYVVRVALFLAAQAIR